MVNFLAWSPFLIFKERSFQVHPALSKHTARDKIRLVNASACMADVDVVAVNITHMGWKALVERVQLRIHDASHIR